MEGGNPYIMSVLTQIGIICTSLFALIGTIVQIKSNSKAKKSDEIMTSIDAKLDALKADSDKADKALRDCIESHHLRYYKDQLVVAMSRIEAGYTPTTEEKHILHEQKAKYNDLGGDSYVDEMWDRLVKKELL